MTMTLNRFGEILFQRASEAGADISVHTARVRCPNVMPGGLAYSTEVSRFDTTVTITIRHSHSDVSGLSKLFGVTEEDPKP